MKRDLSNKGLELIKSFEGCRLKAYKSVPTERYYTIGFGHYGSDVKKGMVITYEQALELLKNDCKKFVNHVNKFMSHYNFNQNQFDALVSFAFNIGNINQLTANKTRTHKQISIKMLEYCKSGGKTITGLVKRRLKEQELYNKPINKKTNEEIAKEVISGEWSNGEERKEKLANNAYAYELIQSIVNSMLKG